MSKSFTTFLQISVPELARLRFLILTSCLFLVGGGADAAETKTQQKTTPTADFNAIMNKARVLKRSRQAALAMPLYKEAIKLRPRNSEAHASLGWEYWELRQPKAAFKEEFTALSLDKNDPLPHHHLAGMYLELGMRPEAADQFRAEYTIAPWRNCHCGPIESLLMQYPPGYSEFLSVLKGQPDKTGTTGKPPEPEAAKATTDKQPPKSSNHQE